MVLIALQGVGSSRPTAAPGFARLQLAAPAVPRVVLAALVEDNAGECRLIGEEAAPDGKLWYACAPGEALPVDEADCELVEFGVGGGPGHLPQEGEKLCQVDKVTVAELTDEAAESAD